MRLERHGPMVRALARRALLALALGCAGGTAVAQVNAPSTPVPLPRERPFAAHTEDMKCRRHEGACINRLRGLAWRDGDHLHLRLANGKTATFTTTSAACAARSPEKCLRFGLVGYYARHRSYLVDANYRGHGGVKLLVSTRTGEHVKLDAYPDFSPSGRRFAAVNSAESGDNSIEVWTASDPPKLEWRYVVPENEYSVYEFAGWDGDDRLKMRVTTRIGEEMHEAVPVEAVRTAAGWRLMPPMLDEAKPSLVTVKPEPALYAWYLRAEFHPRDTAVRGIPVRQLNPDWCKASELRKEQIPFAALMVDGEDEMEASRLSFAVEGSFDQSGTKQTALTGIYEACNGEKGGFVLIMEQPEQPKIRFIDWYATPNAFAALQVLPDSALLVMHCMGCDSFGILEWNKDDARFAWRPEPEDQN